MDGDAEGGRARRCGASAFGSAAHSRTGATTTAYLSDTADVVAGVTDPGNRTTAFTYDIRSRRIEVDAEDTAIAGGTSDNITITHYNPDGTVQETTGDQTYRVTYTYDYADRMKTMTTYGTSTAETEWFYSPDRGFMTRKEYADNEGTDYSYTDAGRLATRTWARGVVTTYGYDNGGRLATTDYSDVTPDVSVAYDALNRPTNQSNGVATCAYAYDPATLRLDTETVSYDWNLDQTADLVRVIDRSHDNLQRPTGYAFGALAFTTPEAEATYIYGATDGRLATVSDGPDTFTYGYTANSSLIATVTAPQHTVTNTWETTRDVLALKENEAGATLVSSYDYGVNSIGQRGNVDTDGTAFSGGQRDRTWTYDHLGQLVAEADANNTAFDRGFAFDAIGNRTASIAGNTDPTASGADSYTPDALNQYTAISTSRSTGVPPVYDADGNALSSDITTNPLDPTAILSSAVFIWDAENRLIEIQDSSNNTLAEYTYDSQSRRIRRKVGTTAPGGPADIAYLYDGWNPIAEYDISSIPSLLLVNLWGMDLSGSTQGAGGVGGLLSVSTSSATWYATYDGNGNVSEYLDSSGAIAAHYEYDAFGNIVNYIESASGVASTFRHRFSTKQQDNESGWLYYGYRYYDPVTGRWPSRDPIGERGGVNLYGFLRNCGTGRVDRLGTDEFLTREDFDPSWIPSGDGVNGGEARGGWVEAETKIGITVVGNEVRWFGGNDDRLWDLLYDNNKLDLKATGISPALALTTLAQDALVYAINDDSPCCIQANLYVYVEKIEIGLNHSGDFWGTAAHELAHIRGAHSRLMYIASHYNKRPRPCYKDPKTAKAKAKIWEVEFMQVIDDAIRAELGHSQDGGHGTPPDQQPTTWDGTYPSTGGP